MEEWRERAVELAPWAVASLLATLVVLTVGARVAHPYDLEWMEGGMLTHGWRLDQGLGLYVPPGPDFVPFIYPPGYSSLLALGGGLAGFSLPMGRAISVVGTVASAGAIAFGVWRHTGVGAAGVFAAVGFLGAFPDSGAFYDLVRPDSVSLAFAAWSIAIAAERWRGAVEAAGLLLCAAFLCKHNNAAFGLAIAAGLWARDGWRQAARFALVAAVPALGFTLGLQWESEGHFLRYLVEVPASHPQHGDRVLPGLPRELGNALPVSAAAIGGWSVLRNRHLPPWTASLPVLGGVGLATGCHLAGPLPAELLSVPAALGGFGIGAAVVGSWIGASELRHEWRWVYAVAVGAVALGVCGLMRSHHGGYLNVYMPLHWVTAFGFGLVLADLRTSGWRALAALLATAELGFAAATLDADALTPTAEDVAAGDAFVQTLRAADGPVLSPFASWMPAQAGHAPSLHMIAVWDLVYEGGPYVDEVEVVRDAIDARYWGAVVEGSRPFTYEFDQSYQIARTIGAGGTALDPKTGWIVRPVRVLVPRSPR